MQFITAANGVTYLQFESLCGQPLTHGIMTRQGGVSPAPWESLNFSWNSVGDTYERIRENNRRAYAALGSDGERTIDRFIAHTNRIWHVDERHIGLDAPYADGFVTTTPDLSLVLTFADCQPIIAYDPVQHVLGIAHAGWRGTVGGIAIALIMAMEEAGSRPQDIITGLGPAIGACCYEVGEEVAAQAATWPGGAAWLVSGKSDRPHFDLNAANDAQLRMAGVRHIEHTDLCTACNTDLFFSYRAEKPVTGRFALIASLTQKDGEHGEPERTIRGERGWRSEEQPGGAPGI